MTSRAFPCPLRQGVVQRSRREGGVMSKVARGPVNGVDKERRESEGFPGVDVWVAEGKRVEVGVPIRVETEEASRKVPSSWAAGVVLDAVGGRG